MPLTDTTEQAILNGLFTDPAWEPPTTLYVGLSSTTPSGDGTGVTEPSTGSYARVATTASDWGAASGTAPAAKTNTTAITFPAATADWASGADLTHFCLFSASTLGTLIAYEALGTAKPVLNGDTATFPPGSLTVRLGAPGDFA